jgi:fluoroacetyl-CoA thioesterase
MNPQRGFPMKDSLKQWLSHEFRFTVTEAKTVPHLFPEAPEFREMPGVLATGFLVGLIEWTCIQAINPHIEWPGEQTVGTQISIQHMAATPPGCDVTVKVRLTALEGRKLTFDFEAADGIDKICKGTHERFVIDAAKFNAKLAAKIEPAGGKEP